MKARKLFNIYGYSGGNFGGTVYDINHLAPTLNTMGGGNRQPMIIDPTACAIRLRDGQTLEESDRQYANAITTVWKDSMVKENLRIRRLTPRECWRLMAFDDEDFDKAQKINSDTQLYRQAGNSIVVKVLEAIFKEMLP